MDNEWYPATGFYFKVEIEGSKNKADNSFKEVTGLSEELGFESVNEGGVNNSTWELPTQKKKQNLVLKRGLMTSKTELIKWVEATIHTDYSKPIELKNIIVKLLNEKGVPIISWTVNNARPVKYDMSDFNSMSNEVLVESLEFSFTSFKRLYAN